MSSTETENTQSGARIDLCVSEAMRDRVYAMAGSSGISVDQWITQCIQASFDIYDSLPHPGDNWFHTDNLAVNNFFHAMEAKLAKKRRQGFGGWDDPSKCSVEFLSRKLREHVEKGDPIDVANFCMMLHQRGSAITPPDSRFEVATVACSVKEMQTSAGSDYFVSVICDGREITPHMFKQRWKADYEVAEWKWLFGQGEKPDILSYGPQEGEFATPQPSIDTSWMSPQELRNAQFMGGVGDEVWD